MARTEQGVEYKPITSTEMARISADGRRVTREQLGRMMLEITHLRALTRQVWESEMDYVRIAEVDDGDYAMMAHEQFCRDLDRLTRLIQDWDRIERETGK